MNSARLDPGLWVILATPFDSDGRVDRSSMEDQVSAARAAGADGVVALGVFGEAASLSLSEQRDMAGIVAAAARGLPLVLGVAGRSTAVAVEQGTSALDAAERSGARRDLMHLMVQINTRSVDAVVDHLTSVHRETGAGIVLQDYPATSGAHMPVADVLRVVERCPFTVAVKAEAPPTPPAIAELTRHCEVPVFGGLGGVGLVDELAMGASGAMTGFSHPEGLRTTIDAYVRGGFEAARRAWAPWLPLANFEAQQGIALALRKMLMHRRGTIAHPAVRPPAPGMPPQLMRLLELHLAAAPPTEGEA